MGKHRVLTREEYAEKFDKLFSKLNYIPQESEKIVQCKEPYPSYWFISNKGYVFSAYKNNIKILKPNFDCTGKANKEGKRAGKCWRYATRIPGNKNLTRYDMSKLMADHFVENEFTSHEDTEIHHIRKKNNYGENEAQKCNSADNLQKLPTSIHKKLTHYASKTSKEMDEDMEKKIQKSGCPVFQFTEEQLKMILFDGIQGCLSRGIEPVVYITSINDDVSKIEAKAHPISRVSDEEKV